LKESLRRSDQAFDEPFKALDTLQRAGIGAIVLVSGSVQERQDLPAVAHVAASRVARENSKGSLLKVANVLQSSVTVAEQVLTIMNDLFPVLQRQ
jgi:hypothetical protein